MCESCNIYQKLCKDSQAINPLICIEIVETMNEDNFSYDERKMRMIGRRTNKTYQLGDKVEVKLTAVDIEKKTIDFELARSKDVVM